MLVAAGLLLSACETTQDKAKRLQAAGEEATAAQVPLTIPKPDKSIKVLDTVLLSDEFGDAVVVELKNTGKETVVNAPILVDLRGADGKSLGKNDAFGLEVSLNHVPLMRPGETVVWVNDQLRPAGEPKSAKVVVGPPASPAPKDLPVIEAGPPKVENNPAGILASGQVRNKSKVDQVKLSLYVVARSGGKIVAAGRGGIKVLKPGKPIPYKAFFVGDPKGAEVTVEAPPSTVQ